MIDFYWNCKNTVFCKQLQSKIRIALSLVVQILQLSGRQLRNQKTQVLLTWSERDTGAYRMELEIIRVLEIQRENQSRALASETTNGSNNLDLPYSSYDFIENNKHIAIPYLTFISALTLVGTCGNFLVLGTLLVNKVNILEPFFCFYWERVFFWVTNIFRGFLSGWLWFAHLFYFQRLRTIGNLFVANLAFADLCVTGFANPFSIIGKLRRAKI